MQGLLQRKLRMLRAERGLTLRQVESMTGIAKETLSGIERGRQRPQDATLARLAAGYSVPLGELLDLVEEDPVQVVEVPKAEAPSSSETGGRRSIKDLPDNAPERLEDLRREVQRWLDEWRSMIRAGVDMGTAVTIKLASYQVHNYLDLSGAFDITNVVFEAREAGEDVPEDLLTRVIALQNVVQSPSGLRSIGDEAIRHASSGPGKEGLKDSVLLRQSG